MRVAVIGAGISGLCVAYQLRHSHDVTVFEANNYAGGHTNTIDVSGSGARGEQALAVDTGFIVFNERTYPNFCRLLRELGVASQPSDMSFSVRCERTGLEYAGTGLNGLFAQRLNLFRPGFWRLLGDWRRFGRHSVELLEQPAESLTVGQFFRQHSYSREFREQYFFPMGSAVWSCAPERLEQFPMRFIVDFYNQHGLLTLDDPPTWRVVHGGSREYVRALRQRLQRPVELSSPAVAISRIPGGVRVEFEHGEAQEFEHVVVACHADQARRLLGTEATSQEREILGAFKYEANVATLHTDVSLLPRRRRAWASWNYRIPAAAADKATVTYNMNRLQNLQAREVYCVTLNGEHQIDPSKVLRTILYHHPLFTLSRQTAQQRHRELIDHQGLSYCGAYWGNGFHEDGVNSALAVSSVLGTAPQPAAAVSV